MTNRLVFLSFLFGAALGIVTFQADTYPPIALSVVAFEAVGLYLLYMVRISKVGFLVSWFFVCYALPFIHLVPYLWFDFDRELPEVMWGLLVNPYMIDKRVVELMAFIGALGAMGFIIGVSLANKKLRYFRSLDLVSKTVETGRSLALPWFFAWVAVGVFLSWLYAPRELIFQARYTESFSISQDWNFGSIWMISYIVLIWLWADALLDTDRAASGIKKVSWSRSC